MRFRLINIYRKFKILKKCELRKDLLQSTLIKKVILFSITVQLIREENALNIDLISDNFKFIEMGLVALHKISTYFRCKYIIV